MQTINGIPAIKITKRDGTELYVLLDRQDYLEARHIAWSMRGGKGSTGLYASNDRIGYLHRWVAERKGLDMAGGREIDHVNGDRLDNRRANLRLAQRSQNMANGPARLRTSQYRGVSWRRRGKAWQAHIMVNRGNHFLGLYESETDAARAYDLAAVAAFGEYARPNLPELINEPAPMRRMR